MPDLPISALKVRGFDIDTKQVTWYVPATTENVLDYTFQIFRSESPAGPFDPITDEFEDRYTFLDARIPAGDKYRTLWYKLRVRHKATDTTKDHGPVSHESDPDLIAAYIRRNEQTLFTQVTGRRVWIYPRRTFGTRCPSCWDTTLGAQKRSRCLTCYDTGFMRGYLNPVETWMQIDPSTKAVQVNAQQKDQQTIAQGRMSFWPVVKPGDVVVEAENKRWRIVTVTPTERLRALVKQEVTMREIHPTDIESKLPINIDEDVKDFQPSPGRMFSNPHNLDNLVDERVPNAFAIYTTYPSDPEE